MLTTDALTNLLLKRKKLAQDLSAHRERLIEAERAITLCAQLSTEIPNKIAAIKSAVGQPAVNRRAPVEDMLNERSAFAQQRQAVASLERLHRELPEIRKFWETRRRQLGA